jgi:hypothetical protein
MITDKQFEDAFTAAGGWFILTQYEEIANWVGSKSDLVDYIYSKNFDKNRTGSNTRVSSVLRIIENGKGREALQKIRDSTTINRQHPEAYSLASEKLSRLFKRPNKS